MQHMELNIGTSIRRLRRERDVTQEELANAIGVTAQAVSKWEREEGYPDITILPEIARFFGVSLDTVCGMDEEREKAEIEKIIREAKGDCGEVAEAMRRGLERFPQSFELKAELAYHLIGCTAENYRKNLEESIRLHEEILERCTDQAIRIFNCLKGSQCHLFSTAGTDTDDAYLPGICKFKSFTKFRNAG